MREARTWLLVGTAAIAAVLLAAVYSGSDGRVTAQEGPSAKPNFVFVLTDDQSADTLRYMPNVRDRLAAEGTTFENFVLTLPVCCPSRATFLRGQYAHNHLITGGSGAAAEAFARRGLDESTVATALDGAGYRTALFGKYLNEYDDARYVPPGWDRWHANVGNDVWSECFSDNGRRRCHEGENPDSLLAGKAERFVRSGSAGEAPFFLWLSLNAPHQLDNGPPPYAARDADKFRDVALPRPPSFDEADVSDKPPWVGGRPRLSKGLVREMTAEHRGRLRSLQTVDRTVASLVDALEDAGELENTYLVFTTDNGYHMGQHRLAPGKNTPYKEDANFPLILRGPGVAPGATRDELVLNTDFAPTLADLAGTTPPDSVDGRSLAPLLESPAGTVPWRDAALVEGLPDQKTGRPPFSGLWTEDGDWYVEYGNGERELYDLSADPYQLENLSGTKPDREAALSTRLDALEECSGGSCRAAENSSSP